MTKKNLLAYLFKYSLWGALAGLVVLFFMPNSRLSFNWQSAQNAWQFYLVQANIDQSGLKAGPLRVEDISFANAVDIASPSVVAINVFRDKGLRDSKQLGPNEKIRDVSIGIGSGVILSSRGYIVTNNHVIENADRISVNFIDGRRRIVEVVGFDRATDIAVLKTDTSGLIPATLALSNEIKTGDIVMAIGNPFALDQQSVSLGIVSAVTLPMVIQTDAAVNTGNSGGALINLKGEVVGINQSKLSSRGGGQTGLNYAIPVMQVKRIAEDIILHGKVRQNWFGVDAYEYKRYSHKRLFPEIAFGTGFFVNNVDENSPASKAGIQKEDFITRFDDKDISGVASFFRLFFDIPIGKKVEVELIRKGKLVNVAVQLIEKPEDE